MTYVNQTQSSHTNTFNCYFSPYLLSSSVTVPSGADLRKSSNLLRICLSRLGKVFILDTEENTSAAHRKTQTHRHRERRRVLEVQLPCITTRETCGCVVGRLRMTLPL